MAETQNGPGRSGRFSHSKQDLRLRTRAFAVRIVHLYQALPKSNEAKMMGAQMFRAGTSVGAHVAEAVRAKSKADFVSKIEGAQQELEETLYWIDLLIDCGIVKPVRLAPLQQESHELMAILSALVSKTRRSLG